MFCFAILLMLVPPWCMDSDKIRKRFW